MVVLLDPFYSVGSYSGFVTYEMGIYDWEWELGIGPTVFGPYHVITYCPSDGDCGILNNYPHGQELSVIARIGDTIRLSYHIEVDGNTTPGYPFASSNYGQEDSPSIWMPIYISLWKLPDLIAEFLDTGFRYPPDPGADLQAEVKLLITNIGEAATQPEQVIDMVFFLRPIDALDGSQDILVSAINNILIDELAPGRSKRIRLSVPFYIPASTYGTYRLGAYIDSSNDVAESNEHNNVITSNAIISISGGIPVRVPDLTGEISKISFRDSPMAGAIGRAAIDVNNIGTGATASKQVIDIEICLRAADATDDTGDITLLTLEDQSISKLAPGSSKTFRTPFNLPAVLGAGEYLLVAKIDSSEVVVELNENNNEALSEHFVIE